MPASMLHCSFGTRPFQAAAVPPLGPIRSKYRSIIKCSRSSETETISRRANMQVGGRSCAACGPFEHKQPFHISIINNYIGICSIRQSIITLAYHSETFIMHKQALLAAAAGLVASPFLPERAWALPASKAQAADVGTYLPPAGVDDFVEFVVSKDKTPVRTLS